MKFLDKIIEKLYLKKENNLAYYDSLTKIYNRNYYERVVKDKYNDAEISFTIIDFNDFKLANDKFGHFYADELLIKYAKEFTQFGLAVRLGGDEFVIIPDEDKIEHLKKYLNENKHVFCNGTIKKTKDQTISEVARKADQALYKQKEVLKKKSN